MDTFTISTHSAREDGDDKARTSGNTIFKFQPTPPARTETHVRVAITQNAEYFNPLRPRGRRHDGFQCTDNNRLFQPTPPARTETWENINIRHYIFNFNPLRPRGRRPIRAIMRIRSKRFQPTPPARTETPSIKSAQTEYISTHSAREDGDGYVSAKET